jgi:hypothetical protein
VLKQRAGVDPTSAQLASDEPVIVVNRAIFGDVRHLFLFIFAHMRGPRLQSRHRPLPPIRLSLRP